MRLRNFTKFAAVLTLSIGGVCNADDDVDVKVDTEGEIKVEVHASATGETEDGDAPADGSGGRAKVEVKSFGKVIRVGPDGEVKIHEFGSDGSDPSFKELRINLRDLLSNRMRSKASDDENDDESGESEEEHGASAEATEPEEDGRQGRRLRGSAIRKLLRLDEDGMFRELQSLPDDIHALLEQTLPKQGFGGNVTIIGPDGKENKIDFGSEDLRAIAPKGMSEEIQSEIEKAMKRMHEFHIDVHGSAGPSDRKQDAGIKGIGDKLDKILKRLENLESDVAELKKRESI